LGLLVFSPPEYVFHLRAIQPYLPVCFFPPALLPRSYLVLDEGHRVKNEGALISQGMRQVLKQNVLMLTGTPLQNNLHELWALLNFMYPDVFTSSAPFDAAFNLAQVRATQGVCLLARCIRRHPAVLLQPAHLSFKQACQCSFGPMFHGVHTTQGKVDARALGAAHQLLRPFMLRRVKDEVECRLPPKVETRINCPLSECQTVSVLCEDGMGEGCSGGATSPAC
jgi:SWI/SNF-related matrix-associated actin-dependent regulator of chromatin subfamily A member 5